eukprot:2915365-Amphidinium_carterae.2
MCACAYGEQPLSAHSLGSKPCNKGVKIYMPSFVHQPVSKGTVWVFLPNLGRGASKHPSIRVTTRAFGTPFFPKASFIMSKHLAFHAGPS